MIRRAFGLMFVLAALVGALDLDASIVSEQTARQYYRSPGFDPYRDRAPLDCAGQQWVAQSADGGPWIHTCLDLVASPAELARWR